VFISFRKQLAGAFFNEAPARRVYLDDIHVES
jgi:hypothetical protein